MHIWKECLTHKIANVTILSCTVKMMLKCKKKTFVTTKKRTSYYNLNTCIIKLLRLPVFQRRCRMGLTLDIVYNSQFFANGGAVKLCVFCCLLTEEFVLWWGICAVLSSVKKNVFENKTILFCHGSEGATFCLIILMYGSFVQLSFYFCCN